MQNQGKKYTQFIAPKICKRCWRLVWWW